MSEKSENRFKDDIAGVQGNAHCKCSIEARCPVRMAGVSTRALVCHRSLDWAPIFGYFLSTFAIRTINTTTKRTPHYHPNPHRATKHHEASPIFCPRHMKKIIG